MARPKVNQETREKIREMITQEYTLVEISEELNVSLSTINRIKKEMPPKQKAAPLKNRSENIITKSEKKYIEKIEKEKLLFEDPQEGWVYHVSKTEQRRKQSGMWWSFIMYPESMPEGAVRMLQCTGAELAISPLHDKDRWEHNSPEVVDEETGEILVPEGYYYKVGDKKKAHYHGLIKFDKRIGFKEANDIIRRCTNGPYVQKCNSLRGAYEYFIHLNNPDRYQYDREEIEIYNGFVVETNAHERKVLLGEVIEFIKSEEVEYWSKIVEKYINDYEVLNVVSRNSFMIKGMIDENWRKKFPEGRTTKVRIVENKKGE